jgi:hypothetical protein
MPHFENSREIVIDAPAATVHALLNDFRQWTAWSPWEELDPELTRTYSGSAAGVGAHYAWAGNNKVGEGSMEITGSTPGQVALDLEFLKPFKASNKTVFTLTPEGAGTRVVWAMSGERNLAFALLGKLFFDKAIAKDFDKGLGKLKAAAESA